MYDSITKNKILMSKFHHGSTKSLVEKQKILLKSAKDVNK